MSNPTIKDKVEGRMFHDSDDLVEFIEGEVKEANREVIGKAAKLRKEISGELFDKLSTDDKLMIIGLSGIIPMPKGMTYEDLDRYIKGEEDNPV